MEVKYVAPEGIKSQEQKIKLKLVLDCFVVVFGSLKLNENRYIWLIVEFYEVWIALIFRIDIK